jgi:hypothetical protein
VDADGIDIDYGLHHAPDAALVVVTPGQQAPLGSTLSLARRLRLLDWAAQEKVWVVEDDYLGELQLKGRATPALASLDRVGRVIHIGSFSKTISPALRLGFIVAPLPLASRFEEVAACLAPAPGPSVQLATAAFMREGHYMRHLRRTKRAYAAQRDALLDFGRAPRTSRLPDWPHCCDCRMAHPIRPSPGKCWRSGWPPHRCRFGTRRQRMRDPVCCSGSRRPRNSISPDPATVFLGSSIASDDHP